MEAGEVKKEETNKSEGTKISLVANPDKPIKDHKEEFAKKRPQKLKNKRRRLTRKQQIRQLLVILSIYIVACILAGFVMYRHYQLYPGYIERATIHSTDRGTDYVELKWNQSRNTKSYTIYYKVSDGNVDTENPPEIDDTWKKASSLETSIKIDKLEEGETYSFAIRPNSADREGILTAAVNFTTQKHQKIVIDDELTKLTSSEPFKIGADAKTPLTFESSDPDVARVNPETGNIEIVDAGTVDITINAVETEDFAAASKTVEVTVYDATPVDASGARPNSIYYVSADNCDVVRSVAGEGGAVTPQGMAFTGDQYLVCFGMYGPTRIVKYDAEGDGREVESPKVSLGHPNGFTYNTKNGCCYCVRGNSNACVIYDTKDESYRSISMPVGCSGIGYDRVRNLLYTSARGSLVSYDPEDYSIKHRFRRVKRGGTEFQQDCEAYDGLMLHCVSGSNKHGTNYIDIYDMENVKYIGTITCDLGEVESAIVNNDGYLEILSNSSTDYIWRTDFNVKRLAEEVKTFKYD